MNIVAASQKIVNIIRPLDKNLCKKTRKFGVVEYWNNGL